MKTWEVIIPPAGGGSLQTLIIEAQTWMMALSEGLRQLSDPAHLSSLMCNILPSGNLEVVDSKSGRTITIRELSPEALQAQIAARTAAQPAPFEAPPPGPAAPPEAAPSSVPPPDPSVAGDKSSATSLGLPALGGQAAAATDGQAVAPTDGKIRRRQTQELTAAASGIATPEPSSYAAPPAAAPPPAPPPTLEPPPKAPEEPIRSSGEFVGVSTGKHRKVTEPAIIIDDVLQAEIEQLETLRKAREAAMTPPTMRPIPHKVFKVIAEAPEAPRNETVRRRYVSVWPNPPRDALEEVLQIQLSSVLSELESTQGSRRILIAAFDHAFEKIPLRPPLGLCTWATTGEQNPAASFVYDDTAAALWSPPSPSTGSGKSPMMVPALTSAANAPAAGMQTALVPDPGELPRPPADTEVVPPLEPPVDPGPPPQAAPPPAAAHAPSAPPPVAPHLQPTPPPAAHYVEAPAPVTYPAELKHGVYESHLPAPTPNPPTGTLDPFYQQQDAASAAPSTPVAPTASEAVPGNLMSAAFERLQALFYVTDRQQAFAYAMDTTLQLVPSAAGVILLYDYEARDLYSAVIRAPGGQQPAHYRVAVADGLAGFCATQGLPLSLTHVDQDQRFQSVLPQLLGLPVASIAGVPIMYQGRLFGVLELLNRTAGGSYTQEELNALAYIGRQLAERLSTTLSQQLPTVQPGDTPPTPQS